MKKTALIFACLMLSACFGGYSESSKFYNLQPITDVSPLSTKKTIIGVEAVELPEYIDRPQIVSAEKGSSQVQISETNRWSESLDTLIQRTLTSDISAYLPQAVVKDKTINDRFDITVEVQMTRLDMITNDKAVLEAWWYILDKSGNTLYREKFSESLPIDASYNSFVSATEKLLSALSREIAEKALKY